MNLSRLLHPPSGGLAISGRTARDYRDSIPHSKESGAGSFLNLRHLGYGLSVVSLWTSGGVAAPVQIVHQVDNVGDVDYAVAIGITGIQRKWRDAFPV